MKKILSDLVSIKSYSGKEKAIASYIKSYFKDLNAEIIEHKGNLIIHIKKNSKSAIIFNAHMDTVALQDIELWETDPFKLEEKDGKYFGLGVSDEKVSIAILMELYEDFIVQSKVDVFLVFVINEEIDGNGSLEVSEFFSKNYCYSETLCVICEPRNANCIGLGNKGNIFFEWTEYGKACHSSEPKNGQNAVKGLLNKIEILEKGFSELKTENSILGFPTLAFPTVIEGGISVNSIPSKCIAKGDVRTTPKTHGTIKDFLLGFKEIKIYSETMPYLLDKNHKFVSLFNELGIKTIQYTKGSNDAVFFGMKGIPSIVFGAGNEECCHIANEYCEIKNIEKTKKVYLGLIKKIT